jgi:hypothetical protein
LSNIIHAVARQTRYFFLVLLRTLRKQNGRHPLTLFQLRPTTNNSYYYSIIERSVRSIKVAGFFPNQKRIVILPCLYAQQKRKPFTSVNKTSKQRIMPNWCYNYLSIDAPDVAAITKFYEENGKEEFSLQHSVPTTNRIDRIDCWGTKWDVDMCDSPDFGPEHKSCHYSFNTAWSPPLVWMMTTSKRYPELQFSLNYEENGFDFRGKTIIKNGIVTYELEQTYYKNATKEDATWVIEQLELDQKLYTTADVDLMFDEQLEDDIGEYSYGGREMFEQEIDRGSLVEKVKECMLETSKQNALKRIVAFSYSVVVLKKFVRFKLLPWVNRPGGIIYEKAKARFLEMAGDE